eukprot:2504714-Rhodomonas_salina.3
MPPSKRVKVEGGESGGAAGSAHTTIAAIKCSNFPSTSLSRASWARASTARLRGWKVVWEECWSVGSGWCAAALSCCQSAGCLSCCVSALSTSADAGSSRHSSPNARTSPLFCVPA